MGMYLLIAARNLLQAKRRTALLGGALGMVTALLVILQSLSSGLTDNMRKSALTLSAGHVNVAGFYKAGLNDAAPVVLDTPTIRKIVEENTPGLDYVIDRNRGWAKLVSDNGSMLGGLAGIDPAQETRLAKSLTPAKESSYKEGGRDVALGDLSRLGEPKSIVVFASQAKKLELSIGDQITIMAQSLRGANNSAEVTVVAVAEDIGLLSSWTTFVAKQTVFDLYQLRSDTTGAVMVYIKNHEDSETAMAALRKAFEEKGYPLMEHEAKPFFQKFETVMNEDWTGQKLDLTTWSDEVSFLQWIIAGLNVITFLLIAILLVIIGIGIMNTMWIAVRERTGEVGTLRAIGMGRKRILALFLTEALLLGLVSTTTGAVGAGALCLTIDAIGIKVPWGAVKAILLSDQVHMNVSPVVIVFSIVLFTLVAGVSALWPALRAALMQPVKAMNAAT